MLRFQGRGKTTRVRIGMLLLLLGTFPACAGGRRLSVDPEYVDGVRQRPLTVEEVTLEFRKRSDRLSRCYKLVRLTYGLEDRSDYVIRYRVPNTGEPPSAEIVQATRPHQDKLGRCIVEQLEAFEFPPHRGKDLVFDVPIRAPKR